jgi:P27 family predicted phage terminase small subunit
MAGRGPAPIPSALKVLRGSRRVNRNEPIPPNGEPNPPADLAPAEFEAWRGVVGELQTVPGLLTLADRGVLELVARTEPVYRDCSAHVREHGSTVVVRDDKGVVRFVQASPQAQLLIKLAAQLKSLYAELGLTPAGRSRLTVAPQKPTSKLDAFLKGGRRGA